MLPVADEWKSAEGTGWITIPGFGEIDPRRDNVAGGRQYFTAKLDNGEYARTVDGALKGGPDTWYYDEDVPFLLGDRDGNCLEVEIGSLGGGRNVVRYRPGQWPAEHAGGW
jgi:hypothetical protein